MMVLGEMEMEHLDTFSRQPVFDDPGMKRLDQIPH